jgi:putative NIF3 family GTP cyclohydrolase 1 type 2
MITVGAVVERLRELFGTINSDVDTLKTGQMSDSVTGIATVFMPSYALLKEAAAQGLNLVVAHEAPFYHHRDDDSMLEDDAVYLGKKQLIASAHLAIFRMHDALHRSTPDYIVEGMARDLGWRGYEDPTFPEALRPLHAPPYAILPMSLSQVAAHVKKALKVPFVRMVGDPDLTCRRVGLLPGYCGGGALAIPYFRQADLDLIITGEGPEWETAEYVRDAVAQGFAKALLVVGHAPSEASGMKYLAERIKAEYPEIAVKALAEAQPFWLA